MSSQSQKSQALLSLWGHLVLTSIAKQTHTHTHTHTHIKSLDAKAFKCHLKCSSKMKIFIRLLCVGSVISL